MVVVIKLPLVGAVRYPSQTRRAFENFVLIFLSVGIVALYSSYRRPIWIDEMQHFAWGGLTDPWVASLEVVRPLAEGAAPTWYSTSWLYFLADVWLLELFGANSTALRAPSLLSGLALLVLTIYFFRRLGLGFIWQALALLALLAQTTYMYYVGEARPYLPMTVAVFVLAGYYATRRVARGARAITVLAWIAGILGALLHTYVLFYAFALAFSFALLNVARVTNASRLQEFVKFLNLPLLATMLGVELMTRLPSLLGPGAQAEAWQGGPWEYLAPAELPGLFVYSHFGFLPLFPWILIGFGVAFAMFVFLISRTQSPQLSRDQALDLAQPMVLIALALALSILISSVSFSQGYWILARHWAASGLLVPVASVWLAAEVTKVLKVRYQKVARSVPIFLVALLVTLAPFRILDLTAALSEYAQIAEQYRAEWAGTTSQDGEVLWGVEDVQNINIYLGGPVWPINACFSPVWQNCPAD